MRAVILSTCYTQSPPSQYGGLEYIAYLLAKELANKGIDTWLVASNDSPDPTTVNGHYGLIRTLPIGHSEHSMYDVFRDQILNKNLIPIDNETVFIDMQHEHWMYMYKKDVNKKINLMSVTHDALPFTTSPPIRYPCMCGISKQQIKLLANTTGSHFETVYNGVDVAKYPLSTEPREDYYLFISRITREKAPHEAIYIANSTKNKLIIAGNDSPMFCEQMYVHSIISKSDGKRITYLGEVSQQKKVELMQKAKCVLLPVQFPEPFGLVAVESMLCGTPVIAMNNGAYGELIIDGTGGFVCNSINEMVEKTKIIEDIKAINVRENGLKFSSEVMVNRYIELMKQCIETPW